MQLKIKNKTFVIHKILNRRVVIFEDFAEILKELNYKVDPDGSIVHNDNNTGGR